MEAQASQVEEQHEKPLEVIELFQNARTPIPWQLWVYADRWTFLTPGTEPRTITRDNLRKWVDVEMLATFGILQVTLDKKILFPLKPEPLAKLQAWLGPPTKEDLAAALKKRYSVGNLVMAGVMILLALPAFMPRWLVQEGTDMTTISPDWVLLAWGGATLIGAGVSKIAPHRSLFLVDLVVQLGLAGWWGYGIATGARSWWLAILIVLMLFGVSVAHKHYKRFATLPRM